MSFQFLRMSGQLDSVSHFRCSLCSTFTAVAVGSAHRWQEKCGNKAIVDSLSGSHHHSFDFPFIPLNEGRARSIIR